MTSRSTYTLICDIFEVFPAINSPFKSYFTPQLSTAVYHTTEMLAVLTDSQQLRLMNWQNWKEKITAFIRVRRLHKYLNGTSLRPAYPLSWLEDPAETLAFQQAQEDWDDDDELAKTIIITNIVDLASSGLETLGWTSCEVWEQLVALQEKRDQLSILNAKVFLRACKWQMETELNTHIAELQRRLCVTRDVWSNLTPAGFSIVICNSMPHSIKLVTMPLLTQSDLEKVIKTILAVYENKRIQAGNLFNPLSGKHNDFSTTSLPVTSAYMTGVKVALICEWCGWHHHSKGDCFYEGRERRDDSHPLRKASRSLRRGLQWT
ncbi:hypothetical protein B0H21DRAFT_706887 [Amylocystis lapponica]|nr:hypothetical protein B0H21DRAFT_706887 [Amylocystis lapponica]